MARANFSNSSLPSFSHERILFPAWTGSNIPTTNSSNKSRMRRRWNRLKKYRSYPLVTIIVFFLLFFYKLISQFTYRQGSNVTLSATLSSSEWADLQILHPPPAYIPPLGNPWRGAGQRHRNDILVSVSGCGGTLRRAIKPGMNIRVRYCARDRNGKIIDVSNGTADVSIGTRQVSIELERALIDLCEGEVIRVSTLDGGSVLVYVERVDVREKGNGDEIEIDTLAKRIVAATGRRGLSCTDVCRHNGMKCEEKGFVVVNNCPRLREGFKCGRCEIAAAGSAGADMPAHVVKRAPKGHARDACLVSPAVERARCRAKHVFTERLCPCLKEEIN